jgi:hypothetical protein
MVVFLVIGLVFMGVGIYFGQDTLTFSRTAQHATGQIVDFEESRDSDGDRTYAPVITYAPAESDPITFTGSIHTSSRPTIGEQVKVLYNPKNLRDARIDSPVDLWLLPGVFGGMGFIFTAIAAGTLLRGLLILALAGRAMLTR